MKLKILLINPWIYDFAAYNLWAKPLGILKVAEYLSSFDTELSLIDCTDSFQIKKYGIGKFKAEIIPRPDFFKGMPRRYRRYGIGIDEFVNKLKAAMPFDVVLITSIMSYWYPGVQKAVEIIRNVSGNVPIVLGGIYATLYYEHAAENSGADFIYRGALNKSLNFVLNTFGFRLKKKRELTPYYKLNLYERYTFAPLLTATGCPFNCSYCASKLLVDSYKKYRIEDILAEIKGLYNLGVRDHAFYDDALLFDSENHIKPLLRSINREGLNIRLHTPNGLHAKFIDEETAYLMKLSNFKTIRISLETTDAERQKTSGAKVKNEDIERAVNHLKKKGFAKKHIGVYLMYGLPGQGIEEVKEGIKFLKSLGVRINLTEFSPIKGTQCWNELVNSGIIDDNLDPLLTNKTVFSYLYSGYNPEDIRKIKLDVKEHNES